MKCIIIGLGYFGKIIHSKLSTVTDNEIFTVDPVSDKADFKSIDDVSFSDGKWFVSTPASTHYKILLQLFDKNIKDIWIEKPICSTFEDTLDIFARIPPDVFLYCDFTWIHHNSINAIGDYIHVNGGFNHVDLKWLNDGSKAPTDVNIVLDLAVHPISIVVFFLIKSRDVIKTINIIYKNTHSVLLSGTSEKGVTFNIEVSNMSEKKNRTISIYGKDVIRWNSDKEFYIENIGDVEVGDAIMKNIKCFFNRNNIGYPLDIARTLEIVNKQFG